MFVTRLMTAIALMVSAPAGAAVTFTDLYTLGIPEGLDFADPQGSQTAVGGQVIGLGTAIRTPDRAILWTPAAPGGINLHPAGLFTSNVYGTDGHTQVGAVADRTTGIAHATLWSGTAASAVDLDPDTTLSSVANVVDGGRQGGVRGNYATLWSGTPGSGVNLNPANFIRSEIVAMGDGQQGGYGYTALGSESRALLWSGTAESAVDLTPSDWSSANVFGIGGGEQVGVGQRATGSSGHALLWRGTADTAIDLHPAGYSRSEAVDADGGYQIGNGVLANRYHALLWHGSANSVIDLSLALPATFTAATVSSISGDTIYGLASDTAGNVHAVTWTIPEPAAMAWLTILAYCLNRNRRPLRS